MNLFKAVGQPLVSPFYTQDTMAVYQPPFGIRLVKKEGRLRWTPHFSIYYHVIIFGEDEIS